MKKKIYVLKIAIISLITSGYFSSVLAEETAVKPKLSQSKVSQTETKPADTISLKQQTLPSNPLLKPNLDSNKINKATKLMGGANGGGGDTLLCRADAQTSQFVGYYSLDYLATYRKTNQNADIVPIKSWVDSVNRITKNLMRLKAYNLIGTFKRFTDNIGNDTNYLSGIIWREAGYGLEDIKDEELLHKLPANCLNQNENGESTFIQTVYWNEYNGLTVYNYDFDVVSALENNAPTQLSFLYVHEWLWMHFSNPQAIRILNRLIHSEKFDTISEEEFRTVLNALMPMYLAQLQQGKYQDDRGDEVQVDPRSKNDTNSIFRFTLSDPKSWPLGYSFICNFNSQGVQNCSVVYPGRYTAPMETVFIPDDALVRVIDFTTMGIKIKNGPERIFKFKKATFN